MLFVPAKSKDRYHWGVISVRPKIAIKAREGEEGKKGEFYFTH